MSFDHHVGQREEPGFIPEDFQSFSAFPLSDRTRLQNHDEDTETLVLLQPGSITQNQVQTPVEADVLRYRSVRCGISETAGREQVRPVLSACLIRSAVRE